MREYLELDTEERIKAFTHPYRMKLLHALREAGRPSTATEVARSLGDGPGKAHYHMRILESAGIVEVARTELVNGIVARYYEPSAKHFSVRGDEGDEGLRDELARRDSERQDEAAVVGGLVGRSRAFREMISLVEQVATSDASVLLVGENGTGKESVAHALHQLSERAKATFVPVHCGSLSPDMLERELFGYEAGAFAGAAERRRSLRSSQGRHALPRRGRVAAGRNPGADPSGAARGRGRADRRDRVGGDRCPLDRRQRSRPPRRGPSRPLPRGSLLSAQRDLRARADLARAS